jgi:monovalent cation/hydrogen antiporter
MVAGAERWIERCRHGSADPRVACALGEIEFVILLLGAAAIFVRLADSISVPYPIVLVIGGLAIGLAPGLPDLDLDPDVVFLVFLPPLLHAAAWTSSPRELRAEVRPLALLSIGLVLATMCAVAVVAHAMVPGMSWEAAFLLGAIVGPTDPVAAIATFSRIGVPARVRLLVEGEAMINDGTALVAYGVALEVIRTGAFSAADALLDFVFSAAGGIVVGLAAGWVGTQVVRRQSDVALSIFVTVIVAYASYIGAEEIGASGALAAVGSGIYSGWNAHSAMDAGTRLSATAFWAVMIFGLEALLFVLLGLQAPQLAEELDVGELALQALIVALTVITVRMAWSAVPWGGFGDSARERIAVGWAGMRGAISLAAALAVPIAVQERPEILLLTFGVILVTLLGQGLTLAPLMRLLRLPGANPFAPDEATARLELAQAALDRLDELEEEGAAAEPLRRLRELYRTRFAVCVAVLGGGELPEDGRGKLREYGAMRRELIGVERASLLALRNDGRVRQDVVRRVERDLDLDESRIRT